MRNGCWSPLQKKGDKPSQEKGGLNLLSFYCDDSQKESISYRKLENLEISLQHSYRLYCGAK
jgi:hypothetical protein